MEGAAGTGLRANIFVENSWALCDRCGDRENSGLACFWAMLRLSMAVSLDKISDNPELYTICQNLHCMRTIPGLLGNAFF